MNNNNKKNKIIKIDYNSDSDSDNYEITPRGVIRKEKKKKETFFMTNEEIKNIEDNFFKEEIKNIEDKFFKTNKGKY